MIEQLINRLKAHKAASGLTWREIADESGLSYSILTKLSCGERDNPTGRVMERINDYLNTVEREAA